MDNTAARHALKDVRYWAKARIASGLESPEASYQYMKLIEAADAILRDLDAARGNASPSRHDGHLRLVDTGPPDDPESSSLAQIVPLPM